MPCPASLLHRVMVYKVTPALRGQSCTRDANAQRRAVSKGLEDGRMGKNQRRVPGDPGHQGGAVVSMGTRRQREVARARVADLRSRGEGSVSTLQFYSGRFSCVIVLLAHQNTVTC